MPLFNRTIATVSPILSNDDLVSHTGDSLLTAKTGRFIKDASLIDSSNIEYFLEAYMSNVDTTGEIFIFINSEVSPRASIIVNTNLPTIIKGSFNLNDLSDGIHEFFLKIKADNATWNINLGLIEIYQR